MKIKVHAVPFIASNTIHFADRKTMETQDEVSIQTYRKQNVTLFIHNYGVKSRAINKIRKATREIHARNKNHQVQFGQKSSYICKQILCNFFIVPFAGDKSMFLPKGLQLQ